MSRETEGEPQGRETEQKKKRVGQATVKVMK